MIVLTILGLISIVWVVARGAYLSGYADGWDDYSSDNINLHNVSKPVK